MSSEKEYFKDVTPALFNLKAPKHLTGSSKEIFAGLSNNT